MVGFPDKPWGFPAKNGSFWGVKWGVPPFQEFTHISLLKLRKSMLGWSSSGFMQGDQDENCNLLTGNLRATAHAADPKLEA